MTTISEAFVTIRPDMSGFEKESTGGIKSALSAVGKIAGGIVAANVLQNAAAGMKNFVGDSIQAASDLEQTIGGVESVFGDSAAGILEWGKTADQVVGLSRNAFNQLAAPIGAMLKNAGIDDFADQTVDLTKKAADLAATFGGPVDEAMNAISSLLRGETNPIERYGVSIKQTDVNLRALADTGKATEKELTAQELTTARLAILYEQTADSVGQFGRESETAAGKAERQRAAQENAAAQLGEHLLPIQLKVTEAKVAFVKVLSERVIPTVARFASIIFDKVVPAIGNFIADIKWVIDNGAGFNEKLSSGAWADLAEAIGVVAIALRDDVIPALRTFSEDVLGALATTFERDIQPRLETFGLFMRDTVLPAMGEFGGFLRDDVMPPLRDFGNWLADHKEVLVAVGVAFAAFQAVVMTAGFVSAIAGIVASVGAFAGAFAAASAAVGPLGAALLVIGGPITATALLIGAVGAAIFLVWQNWDSIWPKLQAGWDAMAGAAVKLKDGVVGAFSSLVDWMRDRFFAFLDSKFIWLAGVLGPAGVLLIAYRFRDEISGAFTAVADSIGDRVDDVGGFLDRLRSSFDGIVSFFTELPGRIADGMSTLAEKLTAPFAEAFDGIKGIINAFIRKWNALEIQVPSVDVPLVGTLGGFAVGTPNLPEFDLGGIVPGRRGVPQLAIVHGGETILPTHRRPGAEPVVNNFNITTNVEERSPAAIKHAVTMAGIELAHEMRFRG